MSMRRWPAILLLLLPAGAAAPQEKDEDPFKGFWKPVDLDLTDVDVGDALGRIFRECGERLDLPRDITEKRISIRLKGATFWQAVDEVCRLHGGLRHPRRLIHEGERRLETGPWIEFPVCTRGPLRLSVFDVARVRELHYPSRLDRTEVTLVLQWTGECVLAGADTRSTGTLRLTRVEDETGKSLLPVIPADNEYVDTPGQSWGAPCTAWLLGLQPAAAGAKKIAVIEGRWEGAILTDIGEIEFEKPGQSIGEVRKVGPLTVKLSRFERSKNSSYSSFTLDLTHEEDAPPSWKEGLKRAPLNRRLLTETESPHLLHAYLWPSEDADSSQVWGYTQAPGPLKLRVARTIRPVDMPFAIKDVRLPEVER